MRWLAAVAAAGTVVLAALHWNDVLAASRAIPLWAFAAAVGLHVATLVLRSEAWRLALAAITGEPLPRMALHGANAAAFVAGVAQSQAALAVRVALLGRLQQHAIRRAHVVLADVPIVAVEIACACLLLAATGVALDSLWVAPAAVAAGGLLLVGARLAHLRFAHRPVAGGLAVLAHTRMRVVLAALIGLVTLGTGARIWVLMAVSGLPVTFASVALVMLSLGVFGLLPLGPSSSPAGTIASLGVSGTAAIGSALVLGIAVSATSICAVAVYAVAVGALLAGGRARRICDVLRPVNGAPAPTPRVEVLPREAADDAAVVDALVRVVNAAYAAGEAGLWVAGTPRTDADEMAAAVGDTEMIAAFDGDGTLVGCARVRPLAPDVVDLGFVSVAPEAWGTGVGRAMVAFAEDVVRRTGVPTMQLELLVPQGSTHPDKERLRAWYLRLGYEIVRTAPFEEVARHAATQLATPCEFLVFHKALR